MVTENSNPIRNLAIREDSTRCRGAKRSDDQKRYPDQKANSPRDVRKLDGSLSGLMAGSPAPIRNLTILEDSAS